MKLPKNFFFCFVPLSVFCDNFFFHLIFGNEINKKSKINEKKHMFIWIWKWEKREFFRENLINNLFLCACLTRKLSHIFFSKKKSHTCTVLHLTELSSFFNQIKDLINQSIFQVIASTLLLLLSLLNSLFFKLPK